MGPGRESWRDAGRSPASEIWPFSLSKSTNFWGRGDPNRVCIGLRPMQPLSRATGACSLAVLSHFLHFLLLPPRSGGHFCVKGISLMLIVRSKEHCRVRNGARRQSASCWRAAACTFPPRSGSLCYRLLSLSERKKYIYASGSGPGNFRWCRSCAQLCR